MDCLMVSLALWVLNGQHQLEVRGQEDREVGVCICFSIPCQAITLAMSAFLYLRSLDGCSVALAFTGPAMLFPLLPLQAQGQ